jgi:hypothetical protein
LGQGLAQTAPMQPDLADGGPDDLDHWELSVVG